jgi:hypothetical protein
MITGNKFVLPYQGSLPVYAIVQNIGTDKVYNGTSTLVTFVAGDIDNYDLLLNAIGGDLVTVTIPSNLPSGSDYVVTYYEKQGGSPHTTDPILKSEGFSWQTSAAVSTANVSSVASASSITPYIDRINAQAYFDTMLYADAWENANFTDRTKALLMATRIISNLNFKEDVVVTAGDTDVPQLIIDACCDIALALLDGVDPEKEIADLRAISQGYSSVRATYDRTLAVEHVVAGVPSQTAWNKLRSFLRDGNSLTLSRVS